MDGTVPKPTEEELNLLRRDAGEGDSDAVAFLRNSEDADKALTEWRRKQIPS